jgi:hypothetical protein
MYKELNPDYKEYDLGRHDMQAHYDQHYADQEEARPIEYYEPAYMYAGMLSRQSVIPATAMWDDVEDEIRRRWESDEENNPWEAVVDAVRHGWENLKSSVAGDDD